MDRQIKLEKHHIDAWGQWWVQWQQATKERMRKHSMSTQMRLKQFEEKHLVGTGAEGAALPLIT